MKERWLDRHYRLGDLNIHYLETSMPGEPTILLHGGSADAAHVSWGPAIAAWSSHLRLIAPDFPGFGQSSRPPWLPSVANLTRFVEEFTAAMDLDRFSIVGLSMGGMVAVNFALRNPDRVRSLVLVDAAGLDKRIPWIRVIYPAIRIKPLYRLLLRLRLYACSRPQLVRFGMRQIMSDANPPTPELLQSVMCELRRPGSAWQSFLNHELCWSGFRRDMSAQLSELRIPTLIVHGEKDAIIPVAHARNAHRRIPNSRLHIFPQCGHWPPREKPDEFSRIVLEFLTERLSTDQPTTGD